MDEGKSEVEIPHSPPSEASDNRVIDEAKFNNLTELVENMRYKDISEVDSVVNELNEKLPIVKDTLGQKPYEEMSIQILRALFEISNEWPYKEKGGKELNHAASSIVASSMTRLEDIISQQDEKSQFKTAQLIEKALGKGDPQNQEIIRDYLLDHLSDWPTKNVSWIILAEALFYRIPQEQVEKAFLWLDKMLKDPQTEELSIDLLARLTGYSSQETKEEIAERFVIPILKSYGLDFNELKNDWAKGGDVYGSFIVENLKRIFELEKTLPEAKRTVCSTLFNEFGIRHFGRYPFDMLIDMYKERNTQKPYGLVLYPIVDHSGAFYDREPLTKFYEKLKKLGFALRVYECESKFGLARAVVKADRRYGQIKPPFIIIGGHGKPNSITFGERKTKYNPFDSITDENVRGILHQADLEGKGARRMGKFLGEDTQIILFSCSTGAEGGIAQAMSERYRGHDIVAPRTPASGITLTPIKDLNGKLRINVEYDATVAETYNTPKAA